MERNHTRGSWLFGRGIHSAEKGRQDGELLPSLDEQKLNLASSFRSPQHTACGKYLSGQIIFREEEAERGHQRDLGLNLKLGNLELLGVLSLGNRGSAELDVEGSIYLMRVNSLKLSTSSPSL